MVAVVGAISLCCLTWLLDQAMGVASGVSGMKWERTEHRPIETQPHLVTLALDHAWAFVRGRTVKLAACTLATVAAAAMAPGHPLAVGEPGAASAGVVAAGSLPSPRSRTSAIWANGKGYVFGGRTGLGQAYASTRQIVQFTPGVGTDC